MITVVRDAMFAGFHQAKCQDGKSCVTDNAKEFCEIHQKFDYDVVMRSYYNFINNFKTNKE